MARPFRTSCTPQQLDVIRMVVEEGKTAKAAMKLVGISYETWVDWRKTDYFTPALEEAKAEYKEGIWEQLRAAGGLAAKTLVMVMNNAGEKGSVRVQAANSILDRVGFKADEQAPTPAATPYATREELVQALSAIPADVLKDAAEKAAAAAKANSTP